ncbi:MAG: hypothetical protein B9S32_13760 [Verrucomicrobia bacterium Tous-C9LFEB]|nr:MAG: hypothetical protein B9S32_13760 [Verrucomicrobia bacterium Tous-C9LFEB]
MTQQNDDNQVRDLRLQDILPSATNPRKHFDEVKLAELAESIKDKGVVQPVVVRRIPLGYELVAGERRWRASQLAEQWTIPALVREYTDEQVLEIQMIENLQRDDLTVLEEADGYARMLELKKDDGEMRYTVDRLAAKIGKSPKYVFSRLQLRRLKGEVLDALQQGILPFSTALILCRVQNEEALKRATQCVLHPEVQEGPLSARETARLITAEFCRELKSAPFNPEDEALLPEAGSCANCPKRSIKGIEFFGSGSDSCYDIGCFQKKTEEHWRLETAAAEVDGRKVLDLETGLKQFYSHNNALSYDSPYVDLSDKPDADEMAEGEKPRKWSSLLKGLEVPVVLARDHKGAGHELVEKNLAYAALREAGRGVLKKEVESSRNNRPDLDEARKEREHKDRQERIALAAMGALHEKLSVTSDQGLWTIVMEHVLALYAGDDGARFMAKRLHIDIKSGKGERPDWKKAILVHTKGMDPLSQAMMVIEALMSRWVKYSGVQQPMFKDLADLCELPMATIIKEVDAAEKVVKKPKVPLPKKCDEKILKSWLAKVHPELNGATWLEISHNDDVCAEFLAWVAETTDQAQEIKVKKFLKGEELGTPAPESDNSMNASTDDVESAQIDDPRLAKLVEAVRSGLTGATEIAAKLKVTKGCISKWASKAVKAKLLKIKDGQYQIVEVA